MQKIDANRFFIPVHFRGSARRVNLFSDLSQMHLNKSYVKRKLVLLEAPYCKVSLIIYTNAQNPPIKAGSCSGLSDSKNPILFEYSVV